MVGLESLVFSTKTKEHRVLEVCWQNNVLVTSLTRQLYTQVPWGQSNEGESWWVAWTGILVDEVFTSISGEGIKGITESASIANMFPSERGQRCTKWRYRGVDGLDQDGLVVEL